MVEFVDHMVAKEEDSKLALLVQAFLPEHRLLVNNKDEELEA